MNGDNDIDVLKLSPSVEVIENVLELRLENPSPKLVLFLLLFTVPQVYEFGSKRTKALMIMSLLNVFGIGGLVNNIRSSNVGVYVEVLRDCFNEELLQSVLLSVENGAQMAEVNKLLFKGQVFSAYTQFRVEKGSNLLQDHVFTPSGYVKFLCKQLITCKTKISNDEFNTFLLSLMSFNTLVTGDMFDIFFTQGNWEFLLSQYNHMKLYQRKKLLVVLLATYLPKRFMSDDSSVIMALLDLIRPMMNDIDLFVVEKVLLSLSKPIIKLCASAIKNNQSLVTSLLNNWGSVSTIDSDPLVVQEHKTLLLIQLIKLRPQTKAQELVASPEFLSSVSNRMNSISNKVRLLAIVFADKLCQTAQRDEIFLMKDLEDYEYLSLDSTYLNEENSSVSPWDIVSSDTVSSNTTSTPTNTESITNPLSQLKLATYKDSDDESEDSDDDDPSVVQRNRLARPVYIKDLIKYLIADEKNPQAYDMRKIVLNSGGDLIRQKAQFGTEVSSQATQLIQTFVGITNTLHHEDFEQYRLNLMVAVLVSHPPTAIQLIKLLSTGDYSLQQRMSILTSLALAARDIRGFKDDSINHSYEEKLFPTKTLPQTLHEKYLSLESQSSESQSLENPGFIKAENSLRNSLMDSKAEDAKDKLSGGKILRMSRKLQPSSLKDDQLIKPKHGQYPSIISKNFYFPLINLWYESGGIDIGHYSSMLIGHYTKTLTLILHSCYSIANVMDIVREWLLLNMDIAKLATINDIQIIEAIATGLLLVTEITDPQDLIVHFNHEIMFFQGWIGDMWEHIIEEKVKSLCAGVLININNIIEKYQANLVDQMNNFY